MGHDTFVLIEPEENAWIERALGCLLRQGCRAQCSWYVAGKREREKACYGQLTLRLILVAIRRPLSERQSGGSVVTRETQLLVEGDRQTRFVASH